MSCIRCPEDEDLVSSSSFQLEGADDFEEGGSACYGGHLQPEG